ncbi:hypothetical protein AYO44_03510 [Planctomycetaceae bacterium SCGC AG-212-F19]|nr:hypothetical protein AYO44_03510 [Planctomycetaceae bacterium SCGC AG-212-F19]
MSQYLLEAEAALALVDARAYNPFVAENWTADQLLAHFRQQAQDRRLLMWGTGGPGKWRVEVAMRWSDEKGFREVQGSIAATTNRLLFADYVMLSRAAEFPNNRLADEEPGDLTVALRPGLYQCRIVQLFDPAGDTSVVERAGTHFLVELESTTTALAPWAAVPWLES